MVVTQLMAGGLGVFLRVAASFNKANQRGQFTALFLWCKSLSSFYTTETKL